MLPAGLALVLAAGCDQAPPGVSPADVEPPRTRLVTLAPALTQMLLDMDLQELLVGVAEKDFAAPERLPKVGNFQSVDQEALVALSPTHVLTMSAAAGVPSGLRQLCEEREIVLVAYPYPSSINDVFRILHELPEDPSRPAPKGPPSLGSLLSVETAAMELWGKALATLAQLSALTDGREVPTVLLVIGLDPVIALGTNTVHNELLSTIHGLNVVDDVAATAPSFDREKLKALGPEVILLLLPKAPALGGRQGDSRLAVFADLDIPAVTNDRIALLNDPLVLLPSTSLMRIAAQMAKAIHPDLAEQVDTILSSDPLETGDPGPGDVSWDPRPDVLATTP